jgi:hypothetical protein
MTTWTWTSARNTHILVLVFCGRADNNTENTADNDDKRRVHLHEGFPKTRALPHPALEHQLNWSIEVGWNLAYAGLAYAELINWSTELIQKNQSTAPPNISQISVKWTGPRFTEIWLMLMLMLIYCEKKNIIRSLKSTAKVPHNMIKLSSLLLPSAP